MTHNEQLYALLTDAAEDCTPLWDAVWEVVGPASDDTDDDSEVRFVACIPEAQRLVRQLMVRGLVGVCRGGGWPPSARNEVEVSREVAEAILSAPANWHLPATASSPYFCFYATEDGMILWRKGRSEFSLAIIP